MNTSNARPSGAFLRNCSCLTSLVVLIYDHATTFRFEYQHIWKRPVTPVKCLYLFCRYLGLICQIVNIILLFTKLYQPPIDPLICGYWYAFLITSLTVLGSALHAIMMLRVYALYGKNVKVGILLAVLLAITAGLSIHAGWLCYPYVRYDDTCGFQEHTHSGMMGLGIWVIVLESIILALTLAKRNASTRHGDIVSKVIRDGGRFFAFMIVGSLVLIFSSVEPISMVLIGFTTIWMLSLSPIMTCGLIREFLQFKTEEAQSLDQLRISSSDVELTSFIDLTN
ncbi:hypothetical protein BDQ17DRAFT_1361650 [Cyathus striatus]|nr:hypothetical protein BDQ17DRAFT_1361650 [Cyathus striatus]